MAMPVTGRRELRGGKRFHCPTIDEDVLIALRRKLGGADSLALFVECSESECQYAEANEPPCPLGPHLFAAEILARRARRALAE
jgi:hypothetical protein